MALFFFIGYNMIMKNNNIQIMNRKGNVIYSTNDYNSAISTLKALIEREQEKRGNKKTQIEYRYKYIDNPNTTTLYQAALYTYRNNKIVEQFNIIEIEQ